MLEVNPRFWTPVQLAISSGVDFPYLIWQLAHEQTETVTAYDSDVTYRWLLPNEILWFAASPDKRRGLSDLLPVREGDVCYSVLSSQDPLPIAGALAQSLDFLRDPEKRRMIFDRGW